MKMPRPNLFDRLTRTNCSESRSSWSTSACRTQIIQRTVRSEQAAASKRFRNLPQSSSSPDISCRTAVCGAFFKTSQSPSHSRSHNSHLFLSQGRQLATRYQISSASRLLLYVARIAEHAPTSSKQQCSYQVWEPIVGVHALAASVSSAAGRFVYFEPNGAVKKPDEVVATRWSPTPARSNERRRLIANNTCAEILGTPQYFVFIHTHAANAHLLRQLKASQTKNKSQPARRVFRES